MTGVTADTNIYISGLHFGGIPLEFLELARAEAFHLAISPPLMTELRRVLAGKFGWSDEAISDAMFGLAECTTLVHPIRIIDAVPNDPDDNRVLECAVAAKSAYIVTGDSDLLSLGSYEGILIVKAAEFLALLPTL